MSTTLDELQTGVKAAYAAYDAACRGYYGRSSTTKKAELRRLDDAMNHTHSVLDKALRARDSFRRALDAFQKAEAARLTPPISYT